MARIRTIKPEYFRHELLQELDAAHPELRPMLVFAGLWGHCDKNGVFEYKPRQLKLDILPFIDFDFNASLVLLREARMMSLMLHGEKLYGYIPTFRVHQRINGKEAIDPPRYPQVAEMTEVKHEGSNGEATEKQQGRQEGKGKEGNIFLSAVADEITPLRVAEERVPYEAIVAAYAELCPSLPKLRGVNDKRKKVIRARWLQHKDIGTFNELFTKAERSDFLTGRDGKWGACFDWLMNENNMQKVLEGNYDNRKGGRPCRDEATETLLKAL